MENIKWKNQEIYLQKEILLGMMKALNHIQFNNAHKIINDYE